MVLSHHGSNTICSFYSDSVADPDLELEGGRGGGGIFALPAFLTPAIFFFFTQNRGKGHVPLAPLLDPPLGLQFEI